MSLKRNLRYEAELFLASSRLQSVASGLKKIIDGKEVNDSKNFCWAGDLTARMDFNSKYFQEKEELCVIATRLRPKFYEAILKFEIPFDSNFSDNLYETLNSGCNRIELKDNELRQAYQLYQGIASSILNDLRNAHIL
jgi:hypothetical protein